MDISDWNEYAGHPNEFWAAPDDRVLHREIPEQEELFWEEFKQGRNGLGFSKIDCDHNRELLLQLYTQATGGALVVRSELNNFWRKLVITHAPFEGGYGFINPSEEVEEEVPVDPRETEAARIAEYEAWSSAPDTSVKMINDRKRTDPAYAAYYHARLQQEVQHDDPMARINMENNMHQPSPSTTTSTSRKVAPPEVQRFAIEYVRMSSEQLKTLLSPVLNPNGPADAQRVRGLFDAACGYGLL